jgi:hypothetical protein
MLKEIDIPYRILFTTDEALKVADKLDFPILGSSIPCTRVVRE